MLSSISLVLFFFFFQAEDGIRDYKVTGVQTCALPISIQARLEQASKSVHCSLYGITNLRLANDLIAAKKRGADIGVGLDKKQAAGKSDLHAKLQAVGILVEIKPVATLEHNKFCVIDGTIVIMGSWNWSNSAPKQDNSDVIITDCPRVAQAFEAAYQRIIERDRP